jgi:hypothetical protein
MHSDKDPLRDRIKQLRGPRAHTKARTGKVTGIHEHYSDPSIARVDLEDQGLGLKGTKTEKKGATASPTSKYDKQFSVEVPKEHASNLALGDHVRVRTVIEKA